MPILYGDSITQAEPVREIGNGSGSVAQTLRKSRTNRALMDKVRGPTHAGPSLGRHAETSRNLMPRASYLDHAAFAFTVRPLSATRPSRENVNCGYPHTAPREVMKFTTTLDQKWSIGAAALADSLWMTSMHFPAWVT